MNSIKILATGMYLPKEKIDNKYFNDKFNLEDNWIYQRTGIKTRYWSENEKIKDLAIKAVEDLIDKNNILKTNFLFLNRSVQMILFKNLLFMVTGNFLIGSNIII